MDEQDLFEHLLTEATGHPFSGWDFSFLSARWRESPLPWDYRQNVRAAFASVETVLDIGTGGGEFLTSLRPWPPQTYATEAYPLNIPIARARLEPLGVPVAAIESAYHLPFADAFFDLVINRHEKFIAAEVARILRPGGRFITQQVGERNLTALNTWLGSEKEERPSSYQRALGFIQQAGIEIIESYEAFPETAFHDVGAVVYLLKAVPWQVPDFSIQKYRERLRAMHAHIQATGQFVASGHRYFIAARKA